MALPAVLDGLQSEGPPERTQASLNNSIWRLSSILGQWSCERTRASTIPHLVGVMIGIVG